MAAGVAAGAGRRAGRAGGSAGGAWGGGRAGRRAGRAGAGGAPEGCFLGGWSELERTPKAGQTLLPFGPNKQCGRKTVQEGQAFSQKFRV